MPEETRTTNSNWLSLKNFFPMVAQEVALWFGGFSGFGKRAPFVGEEVFFERWLWEMALAGAAQEETVFGIEGDEAAVECRIVQAGEVEAVLQLQARWPSQSTNVSL